MPVIQSEQVNEKRRLKVLRKTAHEQLFVSLIRTSLLAARETWISCVGDKLHPCHSISHSQHCVSYDDQNRDTPLLKPDRAAVAHLALGLKLVAVTLPRHVYRTRVHASRRDTSSASSPLTSRTALIPLPDPCRPAQEFQNWQTQVHRGPQDPNPPTCLSPQGQL